jgi:N utilization substance protein B
MYAQWLNPIPTGTKGYVSDIQNHFSLDRQSWEELSPVSPYLPDLRLGHVREDEWNSLAPEVEVLLTGITSNMELIEGAIQKASPNWRLERMPIVDRLLLYIGCYELVVAEVDLTRRSINRTVEMAKRYGEKDSRRFINGILEEIHKNHFLISKMNDEEA